MKKKKKTMKNSQDLYFFFSVLLLPLEMDEKSVELGGYFAPHTDLRGHNNKFYRSSKIENAYPASAFGRLKLKLRPRSKLKVPRSNILGTQFF